MTRAHAIVSVLVSAAAALAVVGKPLPVAAEERFGINLRGGGLIRTDSGYAEHGETFGVTGLGTGGGGAFEGSVRVAPRTWATVAWTGFGSIASKRLSEFRLLSEALLVGGRFNIVDHHWIESGQPLAVTLDVSAAVGRYSLSESFDGQERSDSSAGARVGSAVSMMWNGLGMSVGYAHHRASANLRDNLGGRVRAGGHEISGGLVYRF